ncbi:PTS sugar transporter subunit IIA [Oceanicella sp. SM1341]|uniref:PTS sugar transporter subunit IIA n=1 Tax=Oceanicella sp. SM1341 TaxID=1548889 RepID=UPI000E4F8E56|nr:PTS fructose transporter subunit IIA [Oceanicella sp. SM1341]
MIGLVIVAHGGLAREMLATLEHVVGKQPGARAIGIAPDDDLRAKQEEIRQAVREVEDGSGTVVITDMFGGTPSNLAMGTCRMGNVEVIYGANLPLLVKLGKTRHLPLGESVALALDAGHKYINSAGAILSGGRTEPVQQ